MGRWWRWLCDYYIGLRTRGAIAERECCHDGTEPMCQRCLRAHAGW